MSDSLDRLRGLHSEIKARDEELRSGFRDLEARLKETANGYRIRGQSQNCLLEAYGDDDAYYGYLFFDEALGVAYRTREDDIRTAFEGVPSEPIYSLSSLEKCSTVWLRAVAAPVIIASLLTSIADGLQASVTDAIDGVRTLSMTTNLPLRGLDAGLVDVAEKLNFGDVIQQWQEAQSSLGIDPPDATTRASRLIETLCKHILHTKGRPLPGDQSVKPLYKAASHSLNFSPEQQTSDDLRANGVGHDSARHKHRGLAYPCWHGARNRTSQPITFSQARLAVNAAGVLATFLMDAMLLQTQLQ